MTVVAKSHTEHKLAAESSFVGSHPILLKISDIFGFGYPTTADMLFRLSPFGVYHRTATWVYRWFFLHAGAIIP